MARTLVDALETAARITDRGYTFLDGELRPNEWSFRDLATEAKRRAAKLQARGLVKRDLGLRRSSPSRKTSCSTSWCDLRGYRSRSDVSAPRAGPTRQLHRIGGAHYAGRRRAHAPDDGKQVSPVLWSRRVARLGARGPRPGREAARAARARAGVQSGGDRALRTCFLQFTRGSTAAPKGVVVTPRHLAANMQRHHGSTGLDSRPRGRPLRLLAAALPRHGAGRLHAGAAADAALHRLHADARLRAPAAHVAVDPVAQRRQPRLQPLLRLRPVHAARTRRGGGGARPAHLARRRHRRRHDPAAGDRTLRRGVRPVRLRPRRLRAELRHGRDDAGHLLRWLDAAMRTVTIDRHEATRPRTAGACSPKEMAADAPARAGLRRPHVPGPRDGHLRSRTAPGSASARVGEIRLRGPERHAAATISDPAATRDLSPTAGCARATSATSPDGELYISGRRRTSSSSTAATTTRRRSSG